MSKLAGVLEVMHTSHRRFSTVRASGVSNGEAWRMWWAGPRHIRTEEERGDGASVIVQAGDQWWIREPNGKGHTNDGDPNYGVGFGPGPALLRPRPLLGSTVLEYRDEATVAGRPAAVLRARPRPDGDSGRWWGSGDPFEAAIDLQRGIILRAHGTEMQDVAFDEDLEAAIFASPLVAGQTVESLMNRPRELGLNEALASVGFPVRLPSFIPEGARFIRCLVAPTDPPGWIGMSWTFDPGGRYRLWIRQGPDVAEQTRHSGERIVMRDGLRFQVEEFRGPGHRTTNVTFERAETWFEISSDLPLQTVLDIAISVEETS